MKLTVGPLPSAVYWRRRAIVLGGVLVVAALIWASCSGPPATDKSQASEVRAGGQSTSDNPTQSPTPDVLTPETGGLDDLTPSPKPSVTTAAAGSVPCADADLLLTPVSEARTAPHGTPLRFTLKVKNISARACVRDLGANAQELYLKKGTLKVWSSDACDPLRGSTPKTLSPNEEHAYYVQWKGQSTANGCANETLAAGKYQLVARLDTKVSSAITLTLT